MGNKQEYIKYDLELNWEMHLREGFFLECGLHIFSFVCQDY
jgi:hypothetical protein